MISLNETNITNTSKSLIEWSVVLLIPINVSRRENIQKYTSWVSLKSQLIIKIFITTKFCFLLGFQ